MLLLLFNSIGHAFGYVLFDIPAGLSVLVGVAIATISSAKTDWSFLNQDDSNSTCYSATNANFKDIDLAYAALAPTAADNVAGTVL